MTALLEIADGFGSVFGSSRGISLSAANARDSQQELSLLDTIERQHQIAALLCDSRLPLEGAKLAEILTTGSPATRTSDIIDLLNGTNFTDYLRRGIFGALPLTEKPNLQSVVSALVEPYILASDADTASADALYKALGITLQEDVAASSRKKATSECTLRVCDELAHERALTEEVLQRMCRRSVEVSTASVTAMALVRYNKAAPILGCFLEDEGWRAVMRWWNQMNADNLVGRAQLVCDGVRLHGTAIPSGANHPLRPEGMIPVRSKEARANLQEFNELTTLSRELRKRAETIDHHTRIPGSSSVLTRTNEEIAQIESKLSTHLGNAAPYSAKFILS